MIAPWRLLLTLMLALALPLQGLAAGTRLLCGSGMAGATSAAAPADASGNAHPCPWMQGLPGDVAPAAVHAAAAVPGQDPLGDPTPTRTASDTATDTASPTATPTVAQTVAEAGAAPADAVGAATNGACSVCACCAPMALCATAPQLVAPDRPAPHYDALTSAAPAGGAPDGLERPPRLARA